MKRRRNYDLFKQRTISSPIAFVLCYLFAFIIFNSTKVGHRSLLIATIASAAVAFLNIQILQFFQTQPFAIDRYTKIAQINCVRGSSYFFHVMTTAWQRYGVRMIVVIVYIRIHCPQIIRATHCCSLNSCRWRVNGSRQYIFGAITMWKINKTIENIDFSRIIRVDCATGGYFQCGNKLPN